jgi:hypothetical protein
MFSGFEARRLTSTAAIVTAREECLKALQVTRET